MNHAPMPTIQAAATAGILEHTREHGGDVSAVLRQADLTLDDFRRPEKRLPLPRFVRLIESASRATGDAWFGAHLGQVCPLGALGLPGHIATLAPTVAEGLGYANASSFIRAFRRWTRTTPTRFREEKSGTLQGRGTS